MYLYTLLDMSLNPPVWSVLISSYLSLVFLMAANIEWNSLFLLLSVSSVVVNFFCV